MSKKDVFSKFINPGNEYRGKPFWSWNGELKTEEAVRQAKILGEMGFGGYFMHSRCGLITEYLGDEWFDITNAVSDESEKLGLEAWLYDEDRWPSGSAGGKVSENPKYRMKSLYLFETDVKDFKWDDEIIRAFVATLLDDGISIGGYKEIKSEADVDAAFKALGEGKKKVLSFKIIPDEPNSNYNGNTYIDTMSYEAVNKFIEVTHDEYKKRCGDRIGTSIKGIFTDEPHRGKCMGNCKTENGVRSSAIFYTDDIFEEFEKRYGYDISKILPEIFYRLKGELVSKPKIDYIDLGCNLFNERFAVPINKWCEDNNMILTGHVLHEDLLSTQTAPNGSLMRFYLNMGNPGIDILGNDNRSYWVAKQCQSVCRQFDKKWMLSELYGCSGWEFNLRSHKTLGDWQALFGVNVRCPHLSWYTMEGECKRDYPASVSFQSPYYKDYNFVETYFARIGLMLSEGKPVCDVLVLNPIESVWTTAHLSWANWIFGADKETHVLEGIYQKTFMKLACARIDFDYGEEFIMANYAKVKGNNLTIENGTYKTVVVSGALTIRKTTYDLLYKFLENGGKVVFAGDIPKYVDAVRSDACLKLVEEFENAINVPLDELDKVVSEENPITATASESVFMQTRKDGNDYICVLLNRERNEKSGEFELTADLEGSYRAEIWSPENGTREIYPSVCKDSKIMLNLDLDPAQMIIIVFTESKDEIDTYSAEPLKLTGVLESGEFEYSLDEPNVCVLDYSKFKFEGDEQYSDLGEVLKIDRQIRDRVGIEHRGGEMLQPWFAKSKYTENYGRVSIVYPFNVEVIPQGDIYLAAERPEYTDYYCNGVKLEYKSLDDWWVDNSFIKMQIPADALKVGANEITAIVDFKRTVNVEAVYLLGGFGVAPKAAGSTIKSLPKTLSVDNMAERSLPFFSGRATIELKPDDYLPLIDATAKEIFIKIPEFTGTNVAVEYADKKLTIAWEPYTADVTEAVKAKLPIRITLVNSRRNSFGPLHIVPTLRGSYGPDDFLTSGKAWSDNYSFIEAKIGKVEFFSKN